MTEIRISVEEAVEGLENEVEDLETRLREANASAAAASKRLQEIDLKKDELASGVFLGDPDATAKFKELEDEERETHRSLRVARTAGVQLKEQLAETKTNLEEAEKDVHRERYGELRKELEAVEAERDELAGRLIEVLEKHGAVRSEMSQELRFFDSDSANDLASSAAGAHRKWLKDRFARFLR